MSCVGINANVNKVNKPKTFNDNNNEIMSVYSITFGKYDIVEDSTYQEHRECTPILSDKNILEYMKSWNRKLTNLPLCEEFRKYIRSQCKFQQYIIIQYNVHDSLIDDFNKLLCNLNLNNELITALVNYNVHMTTLYYKYKYMYADAKIEFEHKYAEYVESISECIDNIENYIINNTKFDETQCNKLIDECKNADTLCFEFKCKVNEFTKEFNYENSIIIKNKTILDNYISSINAKQ